MLTLTPAVRSGCNNVGICVSVRPLGALIDHLIDSGQRYISSKFPPTPGKVGAYLRGEWHGQGHSPPGALSVFGLLALLTVPAQAGTGLFANDDITFVGPLFDLVGKNLSNRLTGIHFLVSNAIYVLIALHIAAIAFYGHVRKQNLVRPMLTGWKEAQAESATGGGALALILALAVAGAAVYGASGAWLPPPPPPPPAAETPSW